MRLLAGIVLAGALSGSPVQVVGRPTPGSDLALAKRLLRFGDDADPHVTAATWNGVRTLFVDYETAGEDPERAVVAIQPRADGEPRTIQVTVGEQEGGAPDIVAIGFANADRDAAKELIVILAWPQVQHYDVSGTLYEVRIFDDAKPGGRALRLLDVSRRFGSECDCSWRDGSSKRFRYKTIAAVKAGLKRLGY
ncbi:MAG TPA: hypothetical protein VG939_08005 [Caulobacteraceae bacterium]|nr:hypothetical protein [Caulobacteraceae bacterium]